MNDFKKLERHIVKLLEEHRLDSIISEIQKHVPLDDLLLAFSNFCVFSAMDEEKRRDRTNCKEYREWMKRARIFYDAIKDGRKATVLKRKINIEIEENEEENEEDKD